MRSRTRIFISQSVQCTKGRLLGCDAPYFRRNLPTLRRNLLLPFTLIIGAEGSSKTSLCFHQTTRCRIPEQSTLQKFIFLLKTPTSRKVLPLIWYSYVIFFWFGGGGVYPCGWLTVYYCSLKDENKMKKIKLLSWGEGNGGTVGWG
jgi:hypothetical protein